MKDYLWQMLSAIQYLHAQRILHLDLRSENMIVTEYNLLKVVDLGNAQSLAQERVLPSERFKDYVETMGAWGKGWARSQSLPSAASRPHLCTCFPSPRAPGGPGCRSTDGHLGHRCDGVHHVSHHETGRGRGLWGLVWDP